MKVIIKREQVIINDRNIPKYNHCTSYRRQRKLSPETVKLSMDACANDGGEEFSTKNSSTPSFAESSIDLLAILQKSLDRAIFLYNFIQFYIFVRLSGVRPSIANVHIRKFCKM